MNDIREQVESVLDGGQNIDDRKAYKRKHWHEYKKKNRRVYGNIKNEEYREIKAIADAEGRSVWEQIWQESCHYRSGRKMLSDDTNSRLDDLYFVLRNIGNNINQIAHHSNVFKKLIRNKQIMKQLERLEQSIDDFVKKGSP